MVEKKIVVESRTTNRTLYEMQRTTSIPQSVTAVKVGEEEIVFGAYIVMPDLDHLARKAAQNKTGRAHDGALYVEIHTRRRL